MSFAWRCIHATTSCDTGATNDDESVTATSETVLSWLTSRSAISGCDAGPEHAGDRRRLARALKPLREPAANTARSASVSPPGRCRTATAIASYA